LAVTGADVTVFDRSEAWVKRLCEKLARTGLIAKIIGSDAPEAL